jgi:hypothetical protein
MATKKPGEHPHTLSRDDSVIPAQAGIQELLALSTWRKSPQPPFAKGGFDGSLQNQF